MVTSNISLTKQAVVAYKAHVNHLIWRLSCEAIDDVFCYGGGWRIECRD